MRDEILNYIFERNAPQKKKVAAFLEEKNLYSELDQFLSQYSRFMQKKNIRISDLGDSYLQMVDDMCYARLEFVRTGKYPRGDQLGAIHDVYDNPSVMTKYMLGLAISQFLWRQHYALFKFYRDEIRNISFSPQARVLEVGCGHGLFLSEMLKKLPRSGQVDAVDISATSIQISKDIVSTLFEESLSRIHFIHSDILKYETSQKYDFVTMGEVLEHVERPQDVLGTLHGLLAAGGRAYISTCTNCPALDHVYHFETVDQIREMITASGFQILSEVVEPAECCSQEKLIKRKIDILYGAILGKG